jgi:uncharacterized membrane protein YfcA
MQPERQISIALTIIGAALAAPEFSAIYLHHVPPRAGLMVGALLGAIGAFFGSILASDHPARSFRVFFLVVWTLIALAFSGAALFGAWYAATWGGRALFGLAGVLPLAGPALVLTRRER